MTVEQVAAHQSRMGALDYDKRTGAVSVKPEALAARVASKAKFKNIRSEHDGEKFDSKLEARRFQQLQLMDKAGEIRDLRTQVSFPLMAGDSMVGAYVADAVYFDVRKSRKVVEDCKAKPTRTPLYRWKARHFYAQYGFHITEVTQA